MQQASLNFDIINASNVISISAELVKDAQQRRYGNYCERKPCCRHVHKSKIVAILVCGLQGATRLQ